MYVSKNIYFVNYIHRNIQYNTYCLAVYIQPQQQMQQPGYSNKNVFRKITHTLHGYDTSKSHIKVRIYNKTL